MKQKILEPQKRNKKKTLLKPLIFRTILWFYLVSIDFVTFFFRKKMFFKTVSIENQWLAVAILVGNGSQSNSFISGSQSMFSSLLRSAVNLHNIMFRFKIVYHYVQALTGSYHDINLSNNTSNSSRRSWMYSPPSSMSESIAPSLMKLCAWARSWPFPVHWPQKSLWSHAMHN